MLPRSARLSKDWLITKIRRQGRRVKGRYGIIFFQPACSSRSASRCAIVVAKQVSKKAVERNLAKRRTSEALKQLWPQLRPGYNLVVSLSPSARSAAYRSLQSDLLSLLLKAHLID